MDLRAWDLGQHWLPEGIAENDPMGAMWAAAVLLQKLRGDAEVASSQLSLLETGPTIDAVASQWFKARAAGGSANPDAPRFRSAGGKECVRQYLNRLLRHLGGTPLRRLAGRAGERHLLRVRDEMAKEGLSPEHRRSIQQVARKVLSYAAGEELIDALPRPIDPRVDGEVYAGAKVADPYTEADVRAVRGELYATVLDGRCHSHEWSGLSRREIELGVSARRLYLSWSLYSGMRVGDCNNLHPAVVSPDLRYFWRTSRKTHLVGAKGTAFKMPEQLAVDIDAHLALLGRPWRAHEPICGGPWRLASRPCQFAVERLNLAGHRLGPFDLRTVMRRTTVRELWLRRWTKDEIAGYLGHVDTRMVDRYYGGEPEQWRLPERPEGRYEWDVESSRRLGRGRAPWTARGDVVQFPRTRAARAHLGAAGAAPGPSDEGPAGAE